MKKFTGTCLLFIFAALFLPLQAQTTDAHDKLKTQINKMVESVKETEKADEKRDILNTTFDKLITTFDRVHAMSKVPESDKIAVADFKNIILEKKNELNGIDGYETVQDSQLDDFANYVQQDIEQADRYITISITTALLIVLVLLLL